MKLQVKIPDELHTQLEEVAKQQGLKTVEALIEKGAPHLLTINDSKLQIRLDSQHLAAISEAVGGKLFKTPQDVVDVLIANLRFNVAGVEVQLDPVDANALKEQYVSTSYKDYARYINDSVNEALSVYLWGSTRGILAY